MLSTRAGARSYYRCASSRLARPSPLPLQVVAVRDTYDNISQEEHAAKQPQART